MSEEKTPIEVPNRVEVSFDNIHISQQSTTESAEDLTKTAMKAMREMIRVKNPIPKSGSSNVRLGFEQPSED